MNFQKALEETIKLDPNIKDLPNLEIYQNKKDENHMCRRLQQRAISWGMVKVAITYGRFQYFSHAKTWTLLDKNLRFTPYEKFMDKLRGLRIIAENNSLYDTLQLSTAYWAFDLRK